MIPAHNHSLVLPPFVGPDATARAETSPYDASLTEVVSAFNITPERKAILEGLLHYREVLRGHGIVSGYQWLSGSFTEVVEVLRGRAPGDVDVVTVAARPTHAKSFKDWSDFVTSNANVFNAAYNKLTYKCDTYFIDLDKYPSFIVDDVTYWFSLFSHRRNDGLWKGMLRVPLTMDDDEAIKKLSELPP